MIEIDDEYFAWTVGAPLVDCIGIVLKIKKLYLLTSKFFRVKFQNLELKFFIEHCDFFIKTLSLFEIYFKSNKFKIVQKKISRFHGKSHFLTKQISNIISLLQTTFLDPEPNPFHLIKGLSPEFMKFGYVLITLSVIELFKCGWKRRAWIFFPNHIEIFHKLKCGR